MSNSERKEVCPRNVSEWVSLCQSQNGERKKERETERETERGRRSWDGGREVKRLMGFFGLVAPVYLVRKSNCFSAFSFWQPPSVLGCKLAGSTGSATLLRGT